MDTNIIDNEENKEENIIQEKEENTVQEEERNHKALGYVVGPNIFNNHH